MPVLAGLLTLATLGSTAFAAPSFSLPQAAAYFSSILCAPNAALAATRRVLDDAMDEDAVFPCVPTKVNNRQMQVRINCLFMLSNLLVC